MFTWSAFPFIRYSIALIFGILLYEYQIQIFSSDIFLASVALITILSWVIDTYFYSSDVMRSLAGFFILLVISSTGYFCASLNSESNISTHYSQYQNAIAFKGIVVSDNTERKDYHRYEFEIKSVATNDSTFRSHGKVFLYVRKKDSKTIYNYGHHLSVVAKYHEVGPPGNPEEFDYKSYLEKQNIFSHAFASESDIEILGERSPSPILSIAFTIRSRCKEIIFEYLKEAREQAILSALLIGIKDHLDEETKRAYSSAGAMHVLAVSGLHVGIVYYLIKMLLGFMKKRKWGKFLFILLSISTIWSYALVTGFSPSVLRAAVMFSVVLISETVSKKSNVYNSLGIAAFFLLLYDPYLIHSVGFQLSFAAVFGIVFLQPKLVSLLRPNGFLLNYLWMITCVSIAAQLATFPLTVYYFHQFPTYFLVSNIIVIPAAAVFLVLGILLIIGALIHSVVGQVIGVVLFWLIWVVNELIALLTLLPLPIVDWLYFDFYHTMLVYIIVILFSIAFDRSRKDAFKAGFITILVLTLWINFQDHVNTKQRRLIVYEIKDHIAIDLVDGKDVILLIDSLPESELEVVGFQVNPFRLANGLPSVINTYQEFDETQLLKKMDYGYFLSWNNVNVVIIDSPNKLELVSEIKADIIYLEGTKYWCSENLQSEHVILGANTQYYDLNGIQDRLYDVGIESHSLVEDGFFEVRL